MLQNQSRRGFDWSWGAQMLGQFCQLVPSGAEEPSDPLTDLALYAVLGICQNSVLGIISHLSTVPGEEVS